MPRSFDQLSNWKASEFRSFLLCHGMACMYGVLPEPYYSHFVGFSNAIYLLLQENISASDLQLADKNITYFCSMFSHLYGTDSITMNVHCLLHLCQKVEDLGPLWAQSCFFYEDLNGDLRSLFHGTQNVQTQICHAVCVNNSLPALAEQFLPDSMTAIFYRKLTGHNKIKSQQWFITTSYNAWNMLQLSSVATPQ